MKKRFYLIPLFLFLFVFVYAIAYYPWLSNPRSQEDIAKDWTEIEQMARFPKQCQKDWAALKELFQTAKDASRFAEKRSDRFALEREFSTEWSTLRSAENDLFFEDRDGFFERFQEELVLQWSKNGTAAVKRWKNGGHAPKQTDEGAIFGLDVAEYSSLFDYISLMSEFEEEEPQKLLIEVLQSFLTCGKQIEFFIGVESVVYFNKHASVPMRPFSLGNEQLLALIAREHMWTYRVLEKQDPKKGFLRFRSKAYHERHLPPILRSEHRDVRAWKDTTGQRFRK
ncbi:MAG: hypothetical protein VX278_10360, partial [Myxococcota bacterium]|nr:hypothetical protein [Myxococcota bacterium]